MKKVWINDNLEFVDCDERLLQLVEDNMGKDSVEYIEDNFGYSKCDKCLYVIDLENKNEDLQCENDGLNDEINELNKKIDELEEKLDSKDEND